MSTTEGTSKIKPAQGSEGTGASYNFLPYSLPGQYPNPVTQQIENQPFDIAYASRRQPVQTSDWWTGIGLQWSNDQQTAGWVVGRSAAEGKAGHSKGFIAEPFTMNFIDYGDAPSNDILGIKPLPAGLRLWNPNKLSVQNKGQVTPSDKFDASNNYAGFGNPAEPSPAVTVGLAGVHPLGPDVRTEAPWSNVKVQSYSDWGAVVSYADTSGEMTITMASGSPFVWFERTKGTAAFQVWAGDPKPAEGGALTVWYNSGNVLGVTVSTVYVPFNSLPTVGSPASYVIYADQGTWAEQKASNGAPVSLFTNAAATRAAVLALPHNISPCDAAALIAAKDDFGKYATVKITDTRLHYPPVVGSDATVAVGGQNLPLGFDEKNSVIRSKLQLTTVPFPINGFTGSTPVQIVFPHHRKAMIADSQKNILNVSGAPKYVWNGVIGQYYAYEGASYVRELANPGGLPFLPGVGMNSTLQNPLRAGQSAADDVYQTMKTWFFVEEETLPGLDKDGKPTPAHLGSFARNLGTYVNVQTNTYIQGISGVYESMIIAEQLSHSPLLAETDADFGKSKRQVAAEMRDYLLQTLKDIIGQWADVYTAQFFWYNAKYNSLFGFPQGYGSIQNVNDHHFHYSYFLRAAAAIGRYDNDWLKNYLPFIDLIRRDVATYDRERCAISFPARVQPVLWPQLGGWNGTGRPESGVGKRGDELRVRPDRIGPGRWRQEPARSRRLHVRRGRARRAAILVQLRRRSDEGHGGGLQRQLAGVAGALCRPGRPDVENDAHHERQTVRGLPQHFLWRHRRSLHDPADTADGLHALFRTQRELAAGDLEAVSARFGRSTAGALRDDRRGDTGADAAERDRSERRRIDARAQADQRDAQLLPRRAKFARQTLVLFACSPGTDRLRRGGRYDELCGL